MTTQSLRNRMLQAAAIAVCVAGSAQAQEATPTRARVLHAARFRAPALHESSAALVSRTQPGVVWTMNDSGNPPELFATDTLGRNLGIFSTAALANTDWEALATGPCEDTTCIYIGDVGDNAEERPQVEVYRWAEPVIGRPAGARPGKLRLRYSDGPHDTEAMFVSSDTTLYLVTKGRTRGILLFRVGAPAWHSPDSVVTAEMIQRLPIPVETGIAYQVTDAAIAPDDRQVVIRTYRYLYFFLREADGRLTVDRSRDTCDLGGLEPQGEGVGWLDDRRLVITSEQVSLFGGTIQVVACGN